jgi:hypothetical protein
MEWTKAAWDSYHLFALYCYNATDWLNFNYAFQKSIPCLECKLHFAKIFEVKHVKLGIFRHSVHLHNLINARLGKRDFSYDDALKKYSEFHHSAIREATDEYSILLVKYIKIKICKKEDVLELLTYWPKIGNIVL